MNLPSIDLVRSFLTEVSGSSGSLSALRGDVAFAWKTTSSDGTIGSAAKTRGSSHSARAQFADLLKNAHLENADAADQSKIQTVAGSGSLDNLSVEDLLLLGLSLGGMLGKCPLAKYIRSGQISLSNYLTDVGNGAAANPADTAGSEKAGTLDQILRSLAGILGVNANALLSTIDGKGNGTGLITDNGQGLALGRGTNLLKLLTRLTTFLRQLADTIDGGGTPESVDAASPASSSDFVPRGNGNADGDSNELGVRLISDNGGATGNTSGAEQRPSIVPDLIYFSGIESGQAGSSGGGTNSMRLMVVPQEVGMNPGEALGKIIDKLRRLVQESEGKGSGSLLDSNLQQLVVTRLDHVLNGATGTAAGSTATSDPLLKAEQASLDRLDTVRQTQAAIADMVERMKGEVALDGRNQRAVIHLAPPALGRLHVHMQVDDTQHVLAQISADQRDTQDFLQQSREEMRQGLAQQGFRPEQIDIQFVDEDQEDFARRLVDVGSYV